MSSASDVIDFILLKYEGQNKYQFTQMLRGGHP